MFDFDPGDDLELIVQTAKSFAVEQLLPNQRLHERSRSVPPSIRKTYAGMGLAGLELPEAFGGVGLGALARVLVNEEIAAGGAGAALALDPLGPAVYPLIELGGEEALQCFVLPQRQRLSPRLSRRRFWSAATAFRFSVGTASCRTTRLRSTCANRTSSACAPGGWLAEEFAALGVPFKERGVRTNETIDIMRRCWTDDPIDVSAPVTGVEMVNMRVKPQPKRAIPIWVGGHGGAAYRRAVEMGDGWHGAFQEPRETAKMTARLRQDRPESTFILSMRARWDALKDGSDHILRELDQYREAGIQHIVAEPAQRDQDSWLRCSEEFAKLFELAG